MSKPELHGATLPDGWTVSQHGHSTEMLLIERPKDAAGFGGYVTVEMEERIFRSGIGGHPASKTRYFGRGWKKQLINDACAWLEEAMTRKTSWLNQNPKPPNSPSGGDSPVLAAGKWPEPKGERICNGTSTARYTAPELRPFAGRPGSLDALACPSLQGGRLVYRSAA